MFDNLPVHLVVSGLGLVVGMVFGAVAWRTRFCIAGSVFSAVAAEDRRGLRAIFLAMATAVLLTQGLDAAGLIDTDKSIYRTPTLHWAGAIFGGFIFGYGMILGSGCGAGSLVKLGGGDLRAIIVLMFIALFGYMTLRGITGMPRVALEQLLDIDLTAFGLRSQGIEHLAAAVVPGAADDLRWPVSLAGAAAVLVYVFRDRAFRASPDHIASGLLIGAVVTAGWVVTGHVGADDFDPAPVASLTFVAPVANTLQYAMTFTGASINFGIATVLGVFLGAAGMAVARREFHWQYVDGDRDYVNAMAGGALMGMGGVLAFGCSIGNGLSGISTLSAGAVLGWTAILSGGFFAARRMLAIDD